MEKTEKLGLNLPERGYKNWDVPINENFRILDTVGGGGLEIGDIGIAPFGIDEAQNKRRYLNGQVISQAQFVSFTNKIKSAIELYPNLATSETNWQATVTNSKLGQCGKFVIDDEAGTIRLPKVVNIDGLSDLSLIGNIKAESLPNITGYMSNWASNVNTGSATSALYGTTDNTGARRDSSYTATGCSGINFDASRSSSTYQDNAPVQQEAIQYPYFIQVATGVEESVDVTREIELNNPFSLLDYKWSEYELNNASWLLSNGAFHSGATYVSVYELLLKIHNGTETKDGVSVKLSTEAYTDTDFVINTADTTFRLPIKLADDYVVESYDDGTNWCRIYKSGWIEQGGTISSVATNNTVTFLKPFKERPYVSITRYSTYSGSISIASYWINGFTARERTFFRFSADPNNSSIVLWQACGQGAEKPQSKTYFYVGETIQDANVIAASQVLTTVADSVRKSSAADRATVVGWGMPDYSAGIAISSGYEATESGWVKSNIYSDWGTSSANGRLLINGVIVSANYHSAGDEGKGHNNVFIVPISKGDVVTYTSNVSDVIFYPLKGVI